MSTPIRASSSVWWSSGPARKCAPRSVLRYYAEMSYDEIAESLGVRRAFVGVVLLRARHQLREGLGQRGAAGRAARGAP